MEIVFVCTTLQTLYMLDVKQCKIFENFLIACNKFCQHSTEHRTSTVYIMSLEAPYMFFVCPGTPYTIILCVLDSLPLVDPWLETELVFRNK